MGTSQSLSRDDDYYRTPRAGGRSPSPSEKRNSTPEVSLPPMTLIVEKIVWPDPFATSNQDDCLKVPGSSLTLGQAHRIWCTVLIDGRELGPPISAVDNKRVPLRVEQRSPSSQLVFRFWQDDQHDDKADMKGIHSSRWEPEHEYSERSSVASSRPQSLTSSRQTIKATIQFPIAQLVKYGAPLYAMLCLGLPMDPLESPLPVDLDEAVRRGQLVDHPHKFTITLFRPGRHRDEAGIPHPDIHASLVEDLEPMPLCTKDPKTLGPTCATQIKGLTRSLRLMSNVAYSLQDAQGEQILTQRSLLSSKGDDIVQQLSRDHFPLGGEDADDQVAQLQDELEALEGQVHALQDAARTKDDKIDRLETDLAIAKEQLEDGQTSWTEETGALRDELRQLKRSGLLTEETFKKELARISSQLEDRESELQQAKVKAEKQIKQYTTELEQSNERIKQLNMGKEQWHSEITEKYADLSAEHATKCAEHNMITAEHRVTQEKLKVKEAEVQQKDVELKELQRQHADVQVQHQESKREVLQIKDQLQSKEEQETDFRRWQTKQLEVLRGSNMREAELQKSLSAKDRELEAMQEQRKLQISNSEASSNEIAQLQTELHKANTEIEELRGQLQQSRQEHHRTQSQLTDLLAEQALMKKNEHLWQKLQSELQSELEHAHHDLQRTQTQFTHLLQEQEVTVKTRHELQTEKWQLEEEIRALQEREGICKEDLQDELKKGWDELQVLRRAAEERREEVERARLDLENWTQQHGSTSPCNPPLAALPPSWAEVSSPAQLRSGSVSPMAFNSYARVVPPGSSTPGDISPEQPFRSF